MLRKALNSLVRLESNNTLCLSAVENRSNKLYLCVNVTNNNGIFNHGNFTKLYIRL